MNRMVAAFRSPQVRTLMFNRGVWTTLAVGMS